MIHYCHIYLGTVQFNFCINCSKNLIVHRLIILKYKSVKTEDYTEAVRTNHHLNPQQEAKSTDDVLCSSDLTFSRPHKMVLRPIFLANYHYSPSLIAWYFHACVPVRHWECCSMWMPGIGCLWELPHRVCKCFRCSVSLFMIQWAIMSLWSDRDP